MKTPKISKNQEIKDLKGLVIKCKDQLTKCLERIGEIDKENKQLKYKLGGK